MKQQKTKRLVYLSLLTALAIVLHTIDHYLSAPLPLGVKLGLANIISLTDICYDFRINNRKSNELSIFYELWWCSFK